MSLAVSYDYFDVCWVKGQTSKTDSVPLSLACCYECYGWMVYGYLIRG